MGLTEKLLHNSPSDPSSVHGEAKKGSVPAEQPILDAVHVEKSSGKTTEQPIEDGSGTANHRVRETIWSLREVDGQDGGGGIIGKLSEFPAANRIMLAAVLTSTAASFAAPREGFGKNVFKEVGRYAERQAKNEAIRIGKEVVRGAIGDVSRKMEYRRNMQNKFERSRERRQWSVLMQMEPKVENFLVETDRREQSIHDLLNRFYMDIQNKQVYYEESSVIDPRGASSQQLSKELLKIRTQYREQLERIRRAYEQEREEIRTIIMQARIRFAGEQGIIKDLNQVEWGLAQVVVGLNQTVGGAWNYIKQQGRRDIGTHGVSRPHVIQVPGKNQSGEGRTVILEERNVPRKTRENVSKVEQKKQVQEQEGKKRQSLQERRNTILRNI